MQLTALSTGYAIPDNDFKATIHSVFSTAVNLRPANNDLLFTLVAASEDDLPQGMRLDSPDDFSFEPLVAGMDVFCRDKTLIFDDSILKVEFSHSRRWQCNLPAIGTDVTNPAVAQAWQYVWQVLNEQQMRLGAEVVAQALLDSNRLTQSAISRRIADAVHTLIEITRKYQLNDLSALTQLIGLGPGLTPCGDDVLVGYLAGLWCSVREFVERRQFVSRLGQEVIHLSERTNDISRTYLYHASYGQVSSRLDALTRAISKPENPDHLMLAAGSALESGHTSGMDAVTGLLSGIAAWEGETILAGG